MVSPERITSLRLAQAVILAGTAILRIRRKELDRGKKAAIIRKRAFQWQSFLLLLAALWLQGVVLVSVVLEFKHRVLTPFEDWLKKAIYLLGL